MDQEPQGRSKDNETFDHVEKLLKEAIDKLPEKTAGQKEEGAIKMLRQLQC